MRKRQSRMRGWAGEALRHCPAPPGTATALPPPWLSRGQKSRGSQNAAGSSRFTALPPSLFCSPRNARPSSRLVAGRAAAAAQRTEAVWSLRPCLSLTCRKVVRNRACGSAKGLLSGRTQSMRQIRTVAEQGGRNHLGQRRLERVVLVRIQDPEPEARVPADSRKRR